jgi:hypothetical protein
MADVPGRAVTLLPMTGMGSPAHQALIERVAGHYAADPRVRAVAVFGSVSGGTWRALLARLERE